ncbi:hypothetical protein LCGC14_2164710, partial [marine sediment metagenome]
KIDPRKRLLADATTVEGEDRGEGVTQ